MTGQLRSRIFAVLGAAGTFDQTQAELLCSAWEARLAGKFKTGIDPERDCPELYALALSALVQDSLDGLGGMPASFTAGSVSINGLDASPRRREALELLRPWMQDGRFAFLGVRG